MQDYKYLGDKHGNFEILDVNLNEYAKYNTWTEVAQIGYNRYLIQIFVMEQSVTVVSPDNDVDVET